PAGGEETVSSLQRRRERCQVRGLLVGTRLLERRSDASMNDEPMVPRARCHPHLFLDPTMPPGYRNELKLDFIFIIIGMRRGVEMACTPYPHEPAPPTVAAPRAMTRCECAEVSFEDAAAHL